MPINAFRPFSRLRLAVLLSCTMFLAAPAGASHLGEELVLDQQTISSTNELIAALRRYESAPSAGRAAALQQLTDAAARRRERMLALMERNPHLAATRVMPAALRARLPAAAQAQVERDASVVGVVRGAVADDFERGRSETRLEVIDAAGRRVAVSVADASDREALGWVGKQAAIAGLQLDGRLLVTDKRNLQLLAAGGTTSSATLAAAATPVQGNQTTLVIMLNFADLPIECMASDLQNRLFATTGATTNVGYQQSSGGLVSFSGRVIGPFPTGYTSTGTCDYNGWAAAAESAARAAGVEPNSYMRVSYATPRNANCGWLGLGALGGAQPTPTWTQQCTSTGLFSHELGHNLNFHHAATPGTEYGDASDPMGATKLVQSNAPNRVMAGWVAGTRVQDVSGGGSYSIQALEAVTTAPQVLRLYKADTAEYYYVSMRQPTGIDSNLWSTYQNNLSIHKSTGVMPAYTVLLASLGAGQTFIDGVNGIQITNQGVSGTSATVGIGAGGATCARQAPAISVSPPSQTAAPGTTLGYTVAVTNNNSAACPTSTFNLSQTLPSGFSGAFSNTSVTLAAGASANVAWSVTSAATAPDATYSLTATAAESSVGNASQAHASYTVLAPVTQPPPPPPPAGDTTPPTVAITSPSNGSTIAARVTALNATASDNVGVARVDFYVDDKLIGSDTSAPYGVNWNARKASRGTHSIRARAIDASGNAAEQTISVVVN